MLLKICCLFSTEVPGARHRRTPTAVMCAGVINEPTNDVTTTEVKDNDGGVGTEVGEEDEEGTEHNDDGEEVESGNSCLGRHDYWERAYAKEHRNFDQLGDEGENWFGEEVMQVALAFTDTSIRDRQKGCKQPAETLDILDVGTGNGLLLLALADLGYLRLTGSDYSEHSIILARAVAEKRGRGISVRYVHDDLLRTQIRDRFDVITDKGTLDAVGLMDNAEDNRRLYREATWKLLRPGGLLVITSCNSTREELVEEMTTLLQCHTQPTSDRQAAQQTNAGDTLKAAQPGFRYTDHVRTYPTFRFGGIEGTRVCTVAFERLA